MKHVRVVISPHMQPGVLAFLPDSEAEGFDLFRSNVWNSHSLVLACHPDDECLARDRLAIVQEFTP